MIVERDGWLEPSDPGRTIIRVPTVRTSPLKVSAPIAVVWHHTAGAGKREGPGYAVNLANSIREYRRGVDRAASWHVCLARDGALVQSAPFTVGTWHVAKGGNIAGRWRASVNDYAVGVELEHTGEAGIPYTLAQEGAAAALIGALREAYDLRRADFGYAHRDFDPGRKIDPVAPWMEECLPRALDAVFGATSAPRNEGATP